MAEQTCKDCGGLGEWVWSGKAYFCGTCDGTGTINRTGPYRLADGTWSDGVDRTARISTGAFGTANPERIRVVCQRAHGDGWGKNSLPMQGHRALSWDYLTHAEAIRYAHAQARITKNGDNK